MDCAYEGDETRELARGLGYQPVVPPKPKRLRPWQYDRVAYRRRNEIQRVFRRFDKLDVVFAGFIVLALIVEALR